MAKEIFWDRSLENRRPNDGLQDDASDNATINCAEPVLVRPEFGPDTDLRTILRRNAIGQSPREPQFTETNFDLDLAAAINRVRKIQTAMRRHQRQAKKAEQQPKTDTKTATDQPETAEPV